MPKDDNIEAEGTVVECLRNATFKVKLANGYIVTCTISGKIRMHTSRSSKATPLKSKCLPTTYPKAESLTETRIKGVYYESQIFG